MAATNTVAITVLCTAAHAGKIIAMKMHLQGLAEEDDEGRNREVDVGGRQPPRTVQGTP